MQRQIIHGVPYFIDATNNLYIWDTEQPRTCIGTYIPANQTIAFQSNHLRELAAKLTTWRANQTIRPRKPSNSRGARAQPEGVQSAEHSDNDA